MALTASNQITLGTAAPQFYLIDVVTERMLGLSDVKGEKGTLIAFICNHCPFVIHINQGLIQLARDYTSKGFGFVAISSNDVETHPQDGPEKMKARAKELGYPFPYLYDESQAVAEAYDAACTPDFYLLDESNTIVYHGQLDDSRPGNQIPLTGRDIRNAMDNLLLGKPLDKEQNPSIGCNIKWKS